MVLQAQVLAVMGQTKEAEKMTNHIVSEETGCLECYRLLSAIYSKQERHDKVEGHGSRLDPQVEDGAHLTDSPVCTFTRRSSLDYHPLAWPILWMFFADIPLTANMSP